MLSCHHVRIQFGGSRWIQRHTHRLTSNNATPLLCRTPSIRVQHSTVPRRFASSSTAGAARTKPWNSLTVAFAALVGIACVATAGSLLSRVDDAAGNSKRYASSAEIRKAIDELKLALPGEVVTDPSLLKTYGSSANSYHPASPHAVAVRVQSTEDVVKVVNVAKKYRIPVVPYSGATSLEGHYSGVRVQYYFTNVYS